MGVLHSNQTLSPNSWRSQLQVVLDSSKKQLYSLVPWIAQGVLPGSLTTHISNRGEDLLKCLTY